MNRVPSSAHILRYAPFCLALFLVCRSLAGQSVEDEGDWMIGGGVTFYDLASASGTGIGPSAVVGYRFDESFGLELVPTAILYADGIRTFLGVAGDLGLSVAWQLSPAEFILGSGLSALTGVDGSGGGLGRGGIYVAGQANLRFADHLSLYCRLTARLWLAGHISEEEYGRGGPSAGGGLVGRF